MREGVKAWLIIIAVWAAFAFVLHVVQPAVDYYADQEKQRIINETCAEFPTAHIVIKGGPKGCMSFINCKNWTMTDTLECWI